MNHKENFRDFPHLSEKPPDKEKAAAPAGDRRDGSQDSRKGTFPSHDGAHPVNDDLPLIDRLGIRHRTTILREWSVTTGEPAYKVGEACHD